MPSKTAQRRNLEEDLDSKICRLITASDPDDLNDITFNHLALEVFGYQFEYCAPYQAYCRNLGTEPAKIQHWSEIPPIPTEAFKEAVISTCEPADATYVFKTSGTSAGEKPGIMYRDDAALNLCKMAWLRSYREYMLPDGIQIPFLSLCATPEQAPHASIAHCIEVLLEELGGPGSSSFLNEHGLDLESLMTVLKGLEMAATPVVIYGPTFSFVHIFDWCDKYGYRFRLPAGSRIGHGSGYKGQSRELSTEEFLQRAAEILGVPPPYNIDVLGMTELGSQFYDNVLRNTVLVRKAPRYKAINPWTRTQVLNPTTWEAVPTGEVGVLVHYDLTLRGNVLAVQTEDIGVVVEDGFEILGRATGAAARGCNLTVEHWLKLSLKEE